MRTKPAGSPRGETSRPPSGGAVATQTKRRPLDELAREVVQAVGDLACDELRRRVDDRAQLRFVADRPGSHAAEDSCGTALRLPTGTPLLTSRHGAAPPRSHRRQVSPLCLGAMMFGAWGNPDHDESIRIIHRALDAGINFVDTADVYARGESEEIVGKALKGRRDSVVLATKVHGTMDDTDPNSSGNSRRWIVQEVENSLRRLQTDWIDLYQIHRWDPWTDHDETLGALTDLVSAPARSATSARRRIRRPADRRGAVGRRAARPRAVRVASSRRTRSSCAAIETEVLPVCERYGMGVIPWSPLAGGWLSGTYRKGSETTSRRASRIPARYDLSLPGTRRSSTPWSGCATGRERRAVADRAGARIRAPASGGHRGDHRAAHDGAAREPARRRGRRARPTTSSTRSTRSSRPGRTSTRSTQAGDRPPSTTRRSVAGPPRRKLRAVTTRIVSAPDGRELAVHEAGRPTAWPCSSTTGRRRPASSTTRGSRMRPRRGSG